MKDVASVVALAVATGFTAGALLIGMGYLAYQELVQAGLDPAGALLLMLLIGACLMFFLFRITARRLSLLRQKRAQTLSGGNMAERMSVLMDHFIDGFSEGSRRRR